MKITLPALSIALLMSGCSIGYDAQDAANNRRQDLVGYVLNLKEPHQERVDSKWQGGIDWMLANPQPLPKEIEDALDR